MRAKARKGTARTAKRRARPRAVKKALAQYPSSEELSYEKALAKSVLEAATQPPSAQVAVERP